MYLYSGDLGFNDSIQVLLPHPLEFSVNVTKRFHNCSTDLTSENIIASVHTFYGIRLGMGTLVLVRLALWLRR